MVGFAPFMLLGIVYVFFNYDVPQMCSEPISAASVVAINGKNPYKS
jgi:hypothetical protein